MTLKLVLLLDLGKVRHTWGSGVLLDLGWTLKER